MVETFDEKKGRLWAEIDLVRIQINRIQTTRKALGTIRHLIFCAWVGFKAPVFYTAVGRAYSKRMKEAAE